MILYEVLWEVIPNGAQNSKHYKVKSINELLMLLMEDFRAFTGVHRVIIHEIT